MNRTGDPDGSAFMVESESSRPMTVTASVATSLLAPFNLAGILGLHVGARVARDAESPSHEELRGGPSAA